MHGRLFSSFLCLLSTLSTVFCEHVLICENEERTLQCDDNKTIHISTGMFGRTEKSVCGNNNTNICKDQNSITILRTLCVGKRKCQIPATTSLFGDYCGNQSSYVEVMYTCSDENVDLQSSFVFISKAINLGSSNHMVVAVGVLATLFTISALTLVFIGINAWRRRYVYVRNDRNFNDDLDWSLYASDRDIVQYDFLTTRFNTPIYTGAERTP